MMSTEMATVAKWAKSEEDVQHECNKLIDDFLQEAGMKVKGRYGTVSHCFVIGYDAPNGLVWLYPVSFILLLSGKHFS